MTSDYLTVGTGDSNGLPARNEGHVRLDSLLGNPATPADEADVRIELYSDDVFTKALADYGGELRAQFTVRITDRDNTPTAVAPPGPERPSTSRWARRSAASAWPIRRRGRSAPRPQRWMPSLQER